MAELKISVLYDNCKTNKNLLEGWGFSCLIEWNQQKIFFDTGADEKALFSI
jgi:metal-dependent hydrolase (beta-lactamase superfamily II)